MYSPFQSQGLVSPYRVYFSNNDQLKESHLLLKY